MTAPENSANAEVSEFIRPNVDELSKKHTKQEERVSKQKKGNGNEQKKRRRAVRKTGAVGQTDEEEINT